ncbi:MAG: radical SAM protein [Acidobacteriota bacterium]
MRVRVALCYRCEDRDAGSVYSRIVPAGLLCIHGVLLEAGFVSHLFNFSGQSWKSIQHALASFKPNIVGISHFTYNHSSSMRLYETARAVAPAAVILGGGAQASFLGEEILRRSSALDALIRGEGENPVLELARRVAAGQAWKSSPSLTYRTETGIARTRDCPVVQDLDSCYPITRFTELTGVRPEEQFPFVVTSRGCPGRCGFCDSPAFWGHRIRFRSTANVIGEIRHLMREYGFMYFGFRDDTFAAKRGRLGELCEALQTQIPGILWNCQSRVDTVDRERLLQMKNAGCEQLQFGIESMAPEVLQVLGKRVEADRVHRALQQCREVGIRSCAYLITGVPGQLSLAPESELFNRHGLQQGIVSPLCYYPGTALFETMKAKAGVSEEIFFSGNPEDLKVRRDHEAEDLYRQATRIIEAKAAKNGFSKSEILKQLNATGRCVSSLLDWGNHSLAHGDIRQAREAFEEIRERWPRHPWGYQSLADWAEAYGRPRDARRYREAARQAAMSA